MATLTFTTMSGTQYQVSYTEMQDMVVRWEDPNGNPMVKGSAVKVWEHCTIDGLTTENRGLNWKCERFVFDKGLVIMGTDRYWPRNLGRTTSPIMRVEKDGVEVWSRK